MLKKIILVLTILVFIQQDINAQYSNELGYCNENPDRQECIDDRINKLKNNINNKRDILLFKITNSGSSIEEKLEILKLQEEIYTNSIKLFDMYYSLCVKNNGENYVSKCFKNSEYNQYNLMLNDVSRNISELKIYVNEKELEQKNAKISLDYLNLGLENLNNTNIQTAINFFSLSCEYNKTYECLYYLGLMYDKKSGEYKNGSKDSYIYGIFSGYKDSALENLNEAITLTEDKSKIDKIKKLIESIESYDFYDEEKSESLVNQTNIGNNSNNEIENTNLTDDNTIIDKAGVIIGRLDAIIISMDENKTQRLYVKLIDLLEKYNLNRNDITINEVIKRIKERIK